MRTPDASRHDPRPANVTRLLRRCAELGIRPEQIAERIGVSARSLRGYRSYAKGCPRMPYPVQYALESIIVGATQTQTEDPL